MHQSTSAFIGVMHSKGRFRGRLRVGKTFKFTRWHDDPVSAAHARDVLAVQCYGDNAVLNFDPHPEPNPGHTL